MLSGIERKIFLYIYDWLNLVCLNWIEYQFSYHYSIYMGLVHCIKNFNYTKKGCTYFAKFVLFEIEFFCFFNVQRDGKQIKSSKSTKLPLFARTKGDSDYTVHRHTVPQWTVYTIHLPYTRTLSAKFTTKYKYYYCILTCYSEHVY